MEVQGLIQRQVVSLITTMLNTFLLNFSDTLLMLFEMIADVGFSPPLIPPVFASGNIWWFI